MVTKTYQEDDLNREIEKIDAQLNSQTELKNPIKINTGWKNNPTLEELKLDLHNAKPFRDIITAKAKHWDGLLNPLKKSRKGKSQERPRSEVQPKLIRKMAEWRYANLSEPFLSSDELFAVSPVTWEDRDMANKSSILLNHQFRKDIDFTLFIDDLIRLLVNEGTVILKPEWVSEEGVRTVPEYQYIASSEVSESFEAAFQAALYYHEESPSEYLMDIPDVMKKSVEEYLRSGNIVEFDRDEVGVVEEYYLKKNHPNATIFSVKDVYLDPSTGSNYKDSKFVIYRYESCIADLSADGRYINLDSIDVDSHGSSALHDEDSEGTDTFNYQDRARKRIEVYEYWGYYDVGDNNTLVPIVVTWVGDVVIRMDISPYSDGLLPLIVINYMPVRNSPFGEPDAVLLEDNQEINGAILRGIIDIMGRNANGQRGIPKSMLDATNFQRFVANQDFIYNPMGHPKDSIYTSKFEEIPNSAFAVLNLIQADSESLTGVKGFHQGLSESSLGRVATSVRGVLDASSKRESAILRRISEGLEELGRRFLNMSRDFLEEDSVIRITNDRFMAIFRDEIPSQFDIKLSVTSSEEIQARTQELAFMMQTMAPAMEPGMVKIVLSEYARLSKMPDVAHSIATYEPEPDPVAEQMQMLQLQEYALRVEQAKLNLDSTLVEQALTQAKAMYESAKAQEIQTRADKNILDYTEQATGVKHQRDVDRIQSQARGNMELEERKSRLRQDEERRRAIESYLGRNR